MNKTFEQQHMNLTFRQVSALCGLRLSFYVTAAVLAVSFLCLVPGTYRTASPLYILLFLAVAPSLLQAMLFPATDKKTTKRENSLAFPLFCKKYRYHPDTHKSMNLAYLLAFVLLAAWHISYRSHNGYPSLVTKLPIGIAALSLLVRLLGTWGYRFYFHRFPLKAMH